jgi:glycosidase
MRFLALLPLTFLTACATPRGTDAPAPAAPPAWAGEAVWYQIFPERFRNGDPSNDPTPESMTGAWPQVGADSLRAAGWAPTPWTHDWYAQEAWAQALRPGDFYFGAQLRRYGGDLQGILDQLPYLDSFGVNALYLNPLNDSPSLHKYDARTYRHVDPHFGPDPEGDKAIIATEVPTDPATWRLTAADQLFLDMLAAAHARGIRVVLDFSWNHTGTQFWAFQDVLARGQDSPYADWYRIDAWDDPATPENEFAYSGWAGVRELPELRKVDQTGDPAEGVPYDGTLDPAVTAHILAVSRRWLDPDGDGDPSDGVDGFRLDVAEMVPLGFWRTYRAAVKAVNPDAILVGEIWWQRWPSLMMQPAPYLGDVFDSVMHYRPFEPMRRLLDPTGPQLSPAAFGAHLDSLYAEVPASHRAALMSMSGSHDTPRLATTLQNAAVPYKSEETPRNRPGYQIQRPSADTWRSVDLFRLLQVTLPGAPHVYYGDEVGLWGADDPDVRKPMLWPDLDYAPETATHTGTRPPDPVGVDRDLLSFTRRALALRRAHTDLFARGTLRWDSDGDLLRFERTLDGRTATVLVNLARTPRTATVTGTVALVAGPAPQADADGSTVLPARSGAVFVR